MYRYLAVITLLAALLIGCSDDKGDSSPTGPTNNTPTDSTWSDGAGGWYATLDATSYTNFRYLSLTDHSVKTVADAQTDHSWDIGFRRSEGKTNGGSSGSAGVLSVDLAAIGNADSTSFTGLTTVPAVNASDWRADTLKLRFDGWYDYNMTTHQLTPSRKLYLMTTADSGYAKLVIDSLNDPGQTNAGHLVIKFVYSSDTDLSGAAKYATVDATGGSAFFSLKQGAQVNISHPDTSKGWDLWIGADGDPYRIRINGGASGMGTCALYLGTDLTNDFDQLTTAEPMGYFSDVNLSVFGAEGFDSMTWYSYNGLTHELQTKGRVYLVKLADGSVFKLGVTNYYRVISGTPKSGWITVRFKKM